MSDQCLLVDACLRRHDDAGPYFSKSWCVPLAACAQRSVREVPLSTLLTIPVRFWSGAIVESEEPE